VRAGKYGENEHYALEKNIVTIGWNEIPDISTINTKKDLEDLLIIRYYPLLVLDKI
jgi:restriction system protein